jgi:hypothetical protein
MSLIRFDVFQPNAASRTQAFACLLDTAQKARIMFETVFANCASHDSASDLVMIANTSTVVALRCGSLGRATS